jgi:thiamine-monophosphate kinase
MMKDILENLMIEKITRNFLQAPHKRNKIHEADAELVDLGEGSSEYLAITTDALVEEVESGLYDDPFLIGWMLAMVNFSDLAAVGAEPLGLLLSMSFPSVQDESFTARLTEGISAAFQRLNTFVLGGDSNQGKELFLSGCALGRVPKESTMTRKGTQPGDKLFLTGPAGLGNIFAFLRLTGKDSRLNESFYQPVARIEEGKVIKEFASCCMDTSDGVIHTLDTLMRLNRCGFVLYNDWDRIVHPIALDVCKTQNIAPWLVLAAVHGEFELLFSVGSDDVKKLNDEAVHTGWTPVLIGEVATGRGIRIKTPDRFIPLDTAMIRNLSHAAGSEPERYIKELFDIARTAGI